MESVLDDCLAQFSSKCVLKEERRQAVLGLLEQEDVVAVLTTGFGKILIHQLFAAVKLKQREKNVVLVASPLRILSMIKLKQVNKRKSSPGASNLITARQTNPDLLDLSSVCETVKPRSL